MVGILESYNSQRYSLYPIVCALVLTAMRSGGLHKPEVGLLYSVLCTGYGEGNTHCWNIRRKKVNRQWELGAIADSIEQIPSKETSNRESQGRSTEKPWS